MAKIYNQAYLKDMIVPIEKASVSIASSAVLYGLSVYTVFPVVATKRGLSAFRLVEHYKRLLNSAKIIGIDTFQNAWTYDLFIAAVAELVKANQLTETVFVRATVHVTSQVAGAKSRGLETQLSLFAYEAVPILSQTGVRLKTSVWRRTPDYSIPSRAKVNGAYVNSVLGKQDALDSGCDDCLFLDALGHVCELSASNIFIVREGVLITPQSSTDILEGINRKTILELAADLKIPTLEREIDLTEVYIADEAFACGTSTGIAPIIEVDSRKIGSGATPLTKQIKEKYTSVLSGDDAATEKYFTHLNT
jgi:branched-chain amino acid aminotransferase